MSKSLVYVSVALLALLAGMLTAIYFPFSPSISPANVTTVSPIPTPPPFHDLDGHIHTLAEWQGKVVILNFWATWCPPCREELPEFVQLQKELGEKGLQFIGIAVDDVEAVRLFLKDTPVNYPILLSDNTVLNWADRFGNGVAGLPFSIVLNRKGESVYSKMGLFHRHQVLDAVRPWLSQDVPK